MKTKQDHTIRLIILLSALQITYVVSQIITTIAGNGVAGYNGDNILATNAELSEPFYVFPTSNGNTYIADYSGHRVRKIDSNGIITTIAGIGASGYNGDNILATTAELSYPMGVFVTSTGVIYIADTGNHRIRMIGLNGVITTIAGTGTPGYNGDNISPTSALINSPRNMVVTSTNEIYFSDTENHRIRKINSSGITTIAGTGMPGYNGNNRLATTAQLHLPYYISVSASNDVYIADAYNNQVRKVGVNGIITQIVTSTTPVGVAVSSSNEVYFADASHRVKKVDSKGVITVVAGTAVKGYTSDNVLATTSSLNDPRGIFVAPNNDIYIADRYNYRVRKVLAPHSVTPQTSNNTTFVAIDVPYYVYIIIGIVATIVPPIVVVIVVIIVATLIIFIVIRVSKSTAKTTITNNSTPLKVEQELITTPTISSNYIQNSIPHAQQTVDTQTIILSNGQRVIVPSYMLSNPNFLQQLNIGLQQFASTHQQQAIPSQTPQLQQSYASSPQFNPQQGAQNQYFVPQSQ